MSILSGGNFSSSDGRYECFLNNDDLDKAVSELNEPADNDERLQRIDNLRNAFIKQNKKTLKLIRNDDLFILRFLRARKFHQARALAMMTNYHEQYITWPEVMEKVKNPLSIKHVYNAGCYVVLREKAKDGSAVCIGRPGKVENPVFTEFIAGFVITFERLLEDERVQINGITIIEDMSFVGFELIKQIVPVLKRSILLVEDIVPLRVKSVNFVKEPFLSGMIFGVVRSFLKEKVRNRFLLHGKNFTKLHELIDNSILPPDYGGKGKRIDELVVWWKNNIYDQEIAI